MTWTNHNKTEKSDAINSRRAMHELRTAYKEWMEKKFDMKGCSHEFFGKTLTFASENSWITIKHPSFPKHVHIRHQLWTAEKETKKNPMGRVDLIVDPIEKNEQKHLETDARNILGDEVLTEPHGRKTHVIKKQGFQISFVVPEMRPENGFSEIIAEAVFAAIVRLTAWYLEYRTGQPAR